MTATLRLFEHPNYEGRSQLVSSSRFSRYRHLSERDLERSGLNDRLGSFRLETRNEPKGFVLIIAEHPTGDLHSEYAYENRFDAYAIGPSDTLNVERVSSRIYDRASDVLLIRRSQTEVALHFENEWMKKEVVQPAVGPLTRRVNNDRLEEIRVGEVATRLVAQPSVAPGQVLLGINMDLDIEVERRVLRTREVDGDLELLFAIEAKSGTLTFQMRGFKFDADGPRRFRTRVEDAIRSVLNDVSVRTLIEIQLQQRLGNFQGLLESAYIIPGNANRLRGASPYVGNQETSGTSILYVCGDDLFK